MSLILAIESSGLSSGVALEENSKLLSEKILPPGLQNTRELLPEIDSMLKAHGKTPQDISLVGVSRGPGSFTGLRVGVTVAKTFGYVLQIPLVGIVTLDALAEEADGDSCCPALDAKMNSVFAAVYKKESGRWVRVSDFLLEEPEKVGARLAPGTLVLGDGVARYRTRWENFNLRLSDTPSGPRPGTIARLAREEFAQGKAVSALELAPLYLRRPEAEVKWDRTHGLPHAEDLDRNELDNLPK